MLATAASDYLGKLLNQSIDVRTVLRLSSAQRARFQAWLSQQGVSIDDTVLTGEFSLERLLDGSGHQAARGAPPVVRKEADVLSPTGLTVGIDIQHIGELFQSSNSNDFKSDAELTRIFTLRELSYAQSSTVPMDTLAGIFSAKEAVRKCWGGPALSQEEFRAIEILPDRDGKPTASGFELSIAHSGGLAVAVAARYVARTVPASTPSQQAAPTASEAPARHAGSHRIQTASLVLIAVLVALQLVVLVKLLGWR